MLSLPKCLVTATCLCLLWSLGQAVISDETIGQLARQILLQGEQQQDRIRFEGGSGIVQVKNYGSGSSNYDSYSHIGRAPAAMHDHPVNEDIIGYGEFSAVLNGVQFTTRHNDPKLVQPSTTSSNWHETEPIAFPDVPPSVSSKSNVADQVEEMVEYFRAFKEQNSTHRDYKDYFKPVLCYLEGAWLANWTDLEEAFDSLKYRNFFAYRSEDLQEQSRLQSYIGSLLSHRNNVANLPRVIIGVDPVTNEPIFAQWHYRIVCHPISIDVPTKYFRMKENAVYKERFPTIEQDIDPLLSRGTLFTLDDRGMFSPNRWTLLDEIISKIPGKDNISPADGSTLGDSQFVNNPSLHPITKQPLDLRYYNNKFDIQYADLMREQEFTRGFSDPSMYMALTSQEQVAPIPIRYKVHSKDRGTELTNLRLSWMIPLEIVYLTPLRNWNPHNVITYNYVFYMTPEDLYDSILIPNKIQADSFTFRKGMKDSSGKVYLCTASGVFTITPSVKNGVGNVRLRYPIFPVHFEGNPLWKEVNALRDYITEQLNEMRQIIAVVNE